MPDVTFKLFYLETVTRYRFSVYQRLSGNRYQMAFHQQLPVEEETEQ